MEEDLLGGGAGFNTSGTSAGGFDPARAGRGIGKTGEGRVEVEEGEEW